MPSLAVIGTPPAPPGWENTRAQLVRIVDPLGHAVAWLAPAHYGRCVGFAARPAGERGTAWVHLFRPADRPADPTASPLAPREAGCAVRCALDTNEPGAAHGLMDGWRFVERDPTMAVLVATRATDRPGGGELSLRLIAALTDGALVFDLLVENQATRNLRLHLGLDIGLFAPPLTDALGTVPIDLPGDAIGGDITARVGIPPAAVAQLGGAGARLGVAVEFITGVARLRYHAPGEQAVASLLASAGGEPGGVLIVEPGGLVRLAVAIRVTLNG